MKQRRGSTVFSRTFTEILPYQEYRKTEGEWRDGLVAGNGEQGVICSCSPYSETMVFQNMSFLMPSRQPRFVPPEVSGELEEARQAVIRRDDRWNVHDRKRTYLYCFHPGHRIRIETPRRGLLRYRRETDHETAEIAVTYVDDAGMWERRTFTSREDDVTITKMARSGAGAKINGMLVSIDDIASMRLFGGSVWGDTGKSAEAKIRYKKIADEGCASLSLVAHYPAYDGSELAEGGYAGASRIVAVGGTARLEYGPDTGEAMNAGAPKNPRIRIDGADAVYIVTKTGRTHRMGAYEEFDSAGGYDILDRLLSETAAVIAKYTGKDGLFSYEAAFEPHAAKHARLFDSASFTLGSDDRKPEANEDLLLRQKISDRLLDALVERAYAQGRYAMICCAGFSAPRLCGMWTGEWNPGWNGAYTMDANVNIQVSGMNTGDVGDAALGYVYFVLRQLPDWEENAARVYGMEGALLIPVNTDGDRAIMVEYDRYYPFQYWNAGASWVLLPIYEFWQCFGNRRIPVSDRIRHLYEADELDLLGDVLRPTLAKAASFWQQLCDPRYYMDAEGNARYSAGKKELSGEERYLIIPSYSPENKPEGYDSVITMNATMDVSAARDCLKMAISVEKALGPDGRSGDIEKWERLMDRLPAYRFDETGALREWAVNGYSENNAHRHISHLYCAWPGYETHGDHRLAEGCSIAMENRNRINAGQDDTASHGWVHKALAAARLGNGKAVYDSLLTLMSSDIFYASLMTDHNTDRSVGVYCTDTSLGLVGIVNEMLAYSNWGEIELLPALPEAWRRGRILGLAARTNARIAELDWDIDGGRVDAVIRSTVKQGIKVSCGVGGGVFFTGEGERHGYGDVIEFEAGEEKAIRVRIDAQRSAGNGRA